MFWKWQFDTNVSSLSGRTSSVVAAGSCTNASGEVAAAKPVVLSMGRCIVAEGKKSRTVKSPQEIDKSDVKNKKGKQKKANCLSWNEWRKVRKKKVSPTKSPCDHFETRTKDDMGLSWFWFGVGLVCGLVPPLVFLLFWGSHSAPWPATKTGPLGLPGPDCTGAATMAEESSLLLWCKRCAALTNGAAATALGSWTWDLTAKLGSLLEVPKRFFDVEKETSVIKASRFCGNRRIKKPRKGWKRRLKLRCKPCLNTSLSPCYTGQPEGDLVLCGGVQFGSFDLTVNGSAYYNSTIEFPLGGSIVLGTGKGYIRSINIGSGNPAYDYCILASGGIHRFYVGGSPFPQHLKFQLSLTQAYFNVDVVCHTELQTDVINTKNATDVDLVFKRGDVAYMKFEGTLQAVELTKGAQSNTYNSIGNADVKFRRNTIDFMCFRNGNVEVNTGISLLAESAKFDVIDSATPTDVVFKRGGVNFFTLDGANSIINVSTGRALSSQYIYGDYFYNRNYGADMVFQGSNTTDDGLVEYMRYRKATEDVNFFKRRICQSRQKGIFS